MCGIAGIWGQADEALVGKMMKRLAHRGPDARGRHDGPHGTLGHRRLSIMDPAGGHQPIYSENGSTVIVANGEFYNHPSLKQELGKEHHYRTASDTETVIHLYEEIGKEAVHHLDGMYAFALAEGEDLFLARDPIGIKPLYYWIGNGHVAFASELKALVDSAEDVKTFPPGTWFHSRHGFHTFYEVPDYLPRELPLGPRINLLRQVLENAVVKRLMSDVPLGAFLSGGLDSSLIAALARPHVNELHTFAVGVEGSSDLQAAREVARHLDTVHHEHILEPCEVITHLPRIIYMLESYDQDVVRSAIPCYFTARLAADHVKVILTGEGADELFAGYTYYKEIGDIETLQQELRRSVTALHSINLQRVDRMTMAHSIEGRVPFLDLEVIELAQTIPSDLKLHRDAEGTLIEKWILRKVAEDLLPAEIVWRDKEQFDEGSGTVDLLTSVLPHFGTDRDAESGSRENDKAPRSSAEEEIYYKLLTDCFSCSEPILANVAHWRGHSPD
jgi:asparagine synthase (glutamine-hydrolysing)